MEAHPFPATIKEALALSTGLDVQIN